MLSPKQTVRRYLDALVSGDIDVIRDSFAEDATWSMHSDLPIAGPWKGRDRIVDDFLGAVGAELFDPGTQSFDFPTLIAEGETVVLEWAVNARARTGADYHNDYCGVFIVRDGKIHTVREYFDTSYAARILFAQ